MLFLLTHGLAETPGRWVPRLAGGALALLGFLTALPAARAKDAPVQVHGIAVQDLMTVVHGGVRRGIGAPSLVHVNLTVHGSQWGTSDNTFVFVDLLGTGGSSISARAGDLQILDNVGAPNTLRLYSAWVQHDWRSTRLSLRVGVQDYNAIFDTLDTAGLFLNSSFGIEPTISQSGVSIYPEPTLGAVAHWHGKNGRYMTAGLFGGVPGNPEDPYGTHVAWQARDGAFYALEGGFVSGGARPSKLALGAWADTSRHRNPLYPQRNHGLYLIGETRLHGEGDRHGALDGFVQWGSAMARDNRITRYLGAGLRLRGVFLAGQRDSLGLAVARARVRGLPGGPPGGSETAWELTWAASLGAHFRIQPDLQYIQRPGATGAVPDAWVTGVRLEWSW